MCQKFSQFCSESTKPLLYVGSFLTMISALALGYTGLSAKGLYEDLDSVKATEKAICFYIQIAAATYLIIVTIGSSLAAHHDQKNSIRVLTAVSMTNFVLAVVAILLMPKDEAMVQSFEQRLKDGLGLYNYSDPPKLESLPISLMTITKTSVGSELVANITQQQRDRRSANSTEVSAPTIETRAPLDKKQATIMWDRLQNRLCCGITNATKDWADKLPKSCCGDPQKNADIFICQKVDSAHDRGCLELISTTSHDILVALAIVALASLYVSVIGALSVYRTLYYDEASQNSYN